MVGCLLFSDWASRRGKKYVTFPWCIQASKYWSEENIKKLIYWGYIEIVCNFDNLFPLLRQNDHSLGGNISFRINVYCRLFTSSCSSWPSCQFMLPEPNDWNMVIHHYYCCGYYYMCCWPGLTVAPYLGHKVLRLGPTCNAALLSDLGTT